MFSLYNSVASPTNYRLVEPTLTQKVILLILVSLLFYGFAIKTFMYCGLEQEGKFFEISEREINNVDPSRRIPDVSVEIGSSVNEQANNAQGFQKENTKCPANEKWFVIYDGDE